MDTITRTDIIKNILGKINAKRYVEIGVCKGDNYNQITVEHKIGVDPYYGISNKFVNRMAGICPPVYLCHSFLRKITRGEEFFRSTSGRFFEEQATWLDRNPIDVCFIDGLHTYAQSLDDALNALKYLGPSGFVIMHDCSPTSAAMAAQAGSYEDAEKMNLPGWTGEWCGDVWKTIVYLRSQRPDLRVFVLDTDYGVGIITRGKPERVLPYSKEDIERMTYDDLSKSRKELLDLQEPEYLDFFLEGL